MSYTTAMNNETADNPRTRTRRAYENRTDLQVVPLRLSSEARGRLDRLAEKYGGKRQAVEIALELLDKA